MRALIIDDERRARISMQLLLEAVKPTVRVVGAADGVDPGVEQIRSLQPDLVFLDIKMQDGDAFDLLDQLETWDFYLVFVTAYNHFALRAFEYNAIDYLVKPLDHERLERVFDKLHRYTRADGFKQHLQWLRSDIRSGQLDHLVVKGEKEHLRLQVDEILWMEADGNYCRIWMLDGNRHLVSKNLKHYQELLGEQFCRIHHSVLVNVKRIRKLISTPRLEVELTTGKTLPVSQRKRKQLLAVLGS